MTLLVAVRCKDGVVVGADSLATLGSMGQFTVQEPAGKIYVKSGQVVLAVTGPVGLAQRYFESIPGNPKTAFGGKKAMEVAKALSDSFWRHAETEFARAAMVVQATQNRAALANAQHATLVAVHCEGRDRLFQFTETCAPEEATSDLPYVSLGSGQANADPFLSFLRRVFWEDAEPTVADGIFAVLWTLLEADNSTPSIGGGAQVAVLQKGIARLYEEADLAEHYGAIEAVAVNLRRWRDDLTTPQAATPPPEPPTESK